MIRTDVGHVGHSRRIGIDDGVATHGGGGGGMPPHILTKHNEGTHPPPISVSVHQLSSINVRTVPWAHGGTFSLP